jgi:hypothetical protein
MLRQMTIMVWIYHQALKNAEKMPHANACANVEKHLIIEVLYGATKKIA